MYSPTVDEVGFIRFRRRTGGFRFEAPAGTGTNLHADHVHQVSGPSANRLDFLMGPTPIPANWLAAVERRIRDSIQPTAVEAVNDGRWLSATVALQALRFLQETSDVLPGEPYIYSSMQGDLVAEFKQVHNSVTSIVGERSVVVFTCIEGSAPDKSEFAADDLTLVRQKLQRITAKLRTGKHGALDTKAR